MIIFKLFWQLGFFQVSLLPLRSFIQWVHHLSYLVVPLLMIFACWFGSSSRKFWSITYIQEACKGTDCRSSTEFPRQVFSKAHSKFHQIQYQCMGEDLAPWFCQQFYHQEQGFMFSKSMAGCHCPFAVSYYLVVWSWVQIASLHPGKIFACIFSSSFLLFLVSVLFLEMSS